MRMNEVVKILMQRDGMSENEAWDTFMDVRDELLDNVDSLNACEEILRIELGLEPDYLLDFLSF